LPLVELEDCDDDETLDSELELELELTELVLELELLISVLELRLDREVWLLTELVLFSCVLDAEDELRSSTKDMLNRKLMELTAPLYSISYFLSLTVWLTSSPTEEKANLE
jgi:hypothetical protein